MRNQEYNVDPSDRTVGRIMATGPGQPIVTSRPGQPDLQGISYGPQPLNYHLMRFEVDIETIDETASAGRTVDR